MSKRRDRMTQEHRIGDAVRLSSDQRTYLVCSVTQHVSHWSYELCAWDGLLSVHVPWDGRARCEVLHHVTDAYLQPPPAELITPIGCYRRLCETRDYLSLLAEQAHREVCRDLAGMGPEGQDE